MDNTAIQAIADLAVSAQKANIPGTFVPSILLRDKDGRQHLESIEHLQPLRARFRGTYSTSSVRDFAQYVIARPKGDGFIDVDAMRAVVFFNLNVTFADDKPSDSPSAGHADHRAVLALAETAAFKALKGVVATGVFPQKTLINWIEDWSDFLAADYPDASDVPGNDPTRVRQALTALRKVKIKATGESVHTEKDFGASRSALEDIEASSDVGLPKGFRFKCVSHEGLPEYTFYVRLGVRPDPEKPGFTLQWPKREADMEKLGQSFKAVLLDAIGDKATMLLGQFDPGK